MLFTIYFYIFMFTKISQLQQRNLHPEHPDSNNLDKFKTKKDNIYVR